MRCSICKKQIKFLQRYYDAERIVFFDKKPYMFIDHAHTGCVRKLRKKLRNPKDDKDDNTSNVVYT